MTLLIAFLLMNQIGGFNPLAYVAVVLLWIVHVTVVSK